MREILSVKYKQSSLIFVLSFNLLLITVINFNTKIVFAGNIYLDPNFDKSYLNKTFSTEKVNAQVDCSGACKITYRLSSGVSRSKECGDGHLECCEGGDNFISDINVYDYHIITSASYLYKGAVYYTIHKDCKTRYLGWLANESKYYLVAYSIQFKDALCYVGGNYVRRDTSILGWQQTNARDEDDALRRAALLCEKASFVKAAQNACLTECKRKNDEVRIKLGSKTIETVKDVLDTLTTEQIFYYLPHDSINYLYDPNQIYN